MRSSRSATLRLRPFAGFSPSVTVPPTPLARGLPTVREPSSRWHVATNTADGRTVSARFQASTLGDGGTYQNEADAYHNVAETYPSETVTYSDEAGAYQNEAVTYSDEADAYQNEALAYLMNGFVALSTGSASYPTPGATPTRDVAGSAISRRKTP